MLKRRVAPHERGTDGGDGRKVECSDPGHGYCTENHANVGHDGVKAVWHRPSLRCLQFVLECQLLGHVPVGVDKQGHQKNDGGRCNGWEEAGLLGQALQNCLGAPQDRYGIPLIILFGRDRRIC